MRLTLAVATQRLDVFIDNAVFCNGALVFDVFVGDLALGVILLVSNCCCRVPRLL